MSPLKGGRVRAVLLAHASLQLAHGLIIVLGEPIGHILLDLANDANSATEQDRAQHRDVGAHHQHLQDVGGAMDAAGCGQVRFDPAVQDGDPSQRQPQILGVLKLILV